MIATLFLLLALPVHCDDRIPDDEDSEPELPFEGDSQQEPNDADLEFDDNSIERNEEEAKATPTPEPQPVQKSLKEIVGVPELVVAVVAVVYVVVFIAGRSIVKSKINKVRATLLPSFRRHFAVVPDGFEQRNYHTYDTWVTGRKGYQGGLVTQRFKRTCDPLGIAMSVFKGEADSLLVELLLKPRHSPSMLFHVSKEKPYFADDMKLKSHTMAQKLVAWMDITGEPKQKFMKLVNDFIEQNPGSLEVLEISDTNRFDTKKDNGFVVHFEFRVVGTIEEFMTDELVDFCVAVADEYVLLKLPGELQIRNEKQRERILKEREEKEEKKLTPEEEEKQQKKREKREQKRMIPKVKMVRQ